MLTFLSKVNNLFLQIEFASDRQARIDILKGGISVMLREWFSKSIDDAARGLCVAKSTEIDFLKAMRYDMKNWSQVY